MNQESGLRKSYIFTLAHTLSTANLTHYLWFDINILRSSIIVQKSLAGPGKTRELRLWQIQKQVKDTKTEFKFGPQIVERD